MNLSDIHEGFVDLREPDNRDGHHGICDNHSYLFSNQIVAACAKSWPYFSGCQMYPVGGRSEYLEGCDYFSLWENSLRLELLEHCIQLTSSLDFFPLEAFKWLLLDLGYHPAKIEDLIQELLS